MDANEFDRAMLPLTNLIYDRYLAPDLAAHGLDPAAYTLGYDSTPIPELTRSQHRLLPDWLAAAAFERNRAEWSATRPHWRRVSGGRAWHAFYGDEGPVCGVMPLRGTDRHPARWLDQVGGSWRRWSLGPQRPHSDCARLVRQRGHLVDLGAYGWRG